MSRTITIVALAFLAEGVQALFWLMNAFMHDVVSLDTNAWMFGLSGIGLIALPIGFTCCLVRQTDLALSAAVLTTAATLGVLALYWLDARTATDAGAAGATIAILVLGLVPSVILAAAALFVRSHTPQAAHAARA